MRIDGRLCNVAFFTDVSERVKAQEELQAVQEQLLLAQKMEAVGRLAGGVAHDFNNLLTGIIGFAEFVRERLEPGSQAYQDLSQVLSPVRPGRRPDPPVAGLQPPPEARAGGPRPQRSAGRPGQDAAPPAGGGRGPALHARQSDLGHVRVDPGQMEQVIMNLAVNARDAMPDGGHVSIETANAQLDQDYARTHAGVTPGDYVMVAFSDTGTGMDAETRLAHLRAVLHHQGTRQRHRAGPVHRLRHHQAARGPHLRHSEPGAGTTFKIYLPLVAACP